MKRSAAPLIVLLLTWAWGLGQELTRFDLDRPSELGLTIEADTDVKTEGDASTRIATRWPTTVCLGQISGLQLEAAKLVYRASVKSELEGTAFLEMWVQVEGKEYFSRGLNDTIEGESDWKTIQTPFVLQEGQRADRVTVNLVISGRGTVWVDDVVLSEAPLP